ncbi:transglycosylase domain-containing protein [Microbacterium sp. ARD32]|uniref:transglycosylase domain-containing protein n=1 Tax=Microbacterium sp. ARD32 TaxID=2962577 RepID=UPI0028822315|nr:transglycosylase domain-containing protein [Microbacterium sp. ARD32]MDT0158468.1 transglycosylase domain-containing protein [Microbacterium sp. ARD32]
MPQTNRTVKGVLGGLLGLVGLSAVAGVLATAAVTPAIAIAGVSGSQALTIFENLPDSLTPGNPMEPSVLYATGTDGKTFELARFYDQNRVPVTFDQVSPLMYDALLSSEDKNYYQHGGVNLGATVKAVYDNLRRTSSRGASTITQQFVKNVLIQQCEQKFSPNSTEYDYDAEIRNCWIEASEAKGADGIERKLQEMRYAIQIEKDYSKNDILLGYLNVANFGGQTYGVEAAANYYFGTTAKNLTLDQAAILAGIVQNPNRFRFDRKEGSWTDKDGKARNSKEDGYADTELRRNYVLDRMLKDGKITKQQHDDAKALPITPDIHPSTQGCQTAGKQAYFCQYVKNVIENDKSLGPDKLRRGGLKVYTTLDMRVQQPGSEAMTAYAPPYLEGKSFGATGVTIEADTGRILAIVQNTTFDEKANADAAHGHTSLIYAADKKHGQSIGFPGGSTYKLFTLLEWLKQGHSVNEVLDARTRVFKDFTKCGAPYINTAKIDNFSGNGRVSNVMDFTRTSLNTGFLAMAQELDLCEINKTATSLGVHYGNMAATTEVNPSDKSPNDPYPSVLGSKPIAPIQMAGAYATVANKGIFCEPRAIDKIVGIDGEEIPTPEASCKQVLSPEVAATAAYALQGVMNGGTGGPANPYDGTPLIGKTGTHQSWGTAMAMSSTKAATFVYAGKVNGAEYQLGSQWYNGRPLNTVRYTVSKALQHATDMAYPGTRFPSPDSNLTRHVLKDLPSVVGQSIDDARSTLEAAGFSVNVGDAIDSTVGKGLVAEQSPGAGRVAGGTTVTLSPSTGKAPSADVPNVVDSKFSSAKNKLKKAGFEVDGEHCRGGSTVIAQNPSGDSSAPPGSTVSVLCEGDRD